LKEKGIPLWSWTAGQTALLSSRKIALGDALPAEHRSNPFQIHSNAVLPSQADQDALVGVAEVKLQRQGWIPPVGFAGRTVVEGDRLGWNAAVAAEQAPQPKTTGQKAAPICRQL
jgi:hypothetical protein